MERTPDTYEAVKQNLPSTSVEVKKPTDHYPCLLHHSTQQKDTQTSSLLFQHVKQPFKGQAGKRPPLERVIS